MTVNTPSEDRGAEGGCEDSAGEALLSLRGSGSGLEQDRKPTVKKTKPRKAYTITKQRERWTDSEHERFLQALKRYGRAWRKIEEHIGTKTAVQIRSHAQKFFSKLQREQSVSGGTMEDSSKLSISIPPPRPKRKPAHPYPRKHNTDPQDSAQRSPRHERFAPASHLHSIPSLSHQPSGNHSLQQQQQFPDTISARSQLPDGFPALNTRLEPSLSQVLESAAIAAANAWSEVVASAGASIRQQLQARVAGQPGAAASQSYFGSPPQSNASALAYHLPNLPRQHSGRHLQSTSQHQSKANLSLSRYDLSMPESGWTPPHANGSAEDSPTDTATLESDRDSACSKQYSAGRTDRSGPVSGGKQNKQQGAGSDTRPGSAQLTANPSGSILVLPRSLPRALSSGASLPVRQVESPAPQSNKGQGSSGQDAKPNNRSSSVDQSHTSLTSQMAHFYRQAAANDPENMGRGSSAGEQGSGGSGSGNGSSGKLEQRRSDKGSNNGLTSTSEEDARLEGSGSGSDNGLQENAQGVGSGDGKGSDDGSNSPPAEMTQNSTKSAQPSECTKGAKPQQQKPVGGSSRHAGGIDPTLLAHASANLQNQQFLAPHYVGSHLQGTYVAGITPQTILSQQQALANYQQQALSAWAASAHHQQQAKAATLKALAAGVTAWPPSRQQTPMSQSTCGSRPGSGGSKSEQQAQKSRLTTSGSLPGIGRSSSGVASMDLFRSPSTVSIPLFAPSSSGSPSGRLGEESSGFQPYSKKHAMPVASLPPSKRFAAADAAGSRLVPHPKPSKPSHGLYTPFGNSNAQYTR